LDAGSIALKGPEFAPELDIRRAVFSVIQEAARFNPMPRPSHLSEDVLGYRIHTNRELGMMLRREKPLAMFSSGIEGDFGEPLRRYLQMFDRHVEAGSSQEAVISRR
jgi:hypothetical protein